MRLEIYTTKDLQHVDQILKQAESESVTDIRFIRTKLHNHTYKRRKNRIGKTHKDNYVKPEKCPSCDLLSMIPIDSGNQNIIITECKLCRYSTYTERKINNV